MVRVFVLAFLLAGLVAAPVHAQPTFAVPNFVDEVVAFGDGTSALDFTPNGALYVSEKKGRVLYLLPNGSGGFQNPQVLFDIQNQVDSTTECGLLGLAIDPEYATNRYLYVLYTTTTDQRLVRYTLNAAGTSASSATTVLSGLPRTTSIHNGGDIKFRPGEPGSIYISLGDDGAPAEAASLTSHRGKILRVNKTNGQGLPSNPYYVSGSLATARARLWAIGMRNPFRFTFHPGVNQPRSDVMYVSENGDSTDKLAWVQGGSNGGWSPAGDGPFINVADPDHRVLYTGPASHIGVAVAATGPFTDAGTPVVYLGNWVNPTGGSIRRFRLTGAELDTANVVPADGGAPFVTRRYTTSLKFGPDGHLYYTATGNGQALGGFYPVGRIRYVGGVPPVASFTTSPSPAQGPFPLTVQFSDASTDSDGVIQTRAWNFGDGGTSGQTNPTHTYNAPGNYTVTLTVTDDDGLTNATTGAVQAIASFTLDLNGEVLDGGSATGGRRTGTTQLRFYQQDGTPIVLPSGLGPNENGANVVNGDIDLVLPMNLTSSFVVVTAGEAEPGLRVQTVAFEVPTGQSAHSETITMWPSSTAVRGRVRDTQMAPAEVDLGIARGDIAGLYAVVGGRDYIGGSGFPPTMVNHRVVSDALGYYYFPLRDAGAYFLDAVGDTGSATYLATLVQTMVAANAAVDLDLTLGLRSGGASCDDLSAIPTTPTVDYASQVQPIWGVCIGCHRMNSANGGGLDLTAANSWAALVGVASTQVPGRALVTPNDPANSYLMEKISCASPQVGNRMRPDSPMSLQEQALVRDWISQGAAQMAVTPPTDGGIPDNGGVDTGVPDTGSADGGVSDQGTIDQGTPDSGVVIDGGPAPDAGVSNTGDGSVDAGVEPGDAMISGGCRCAGGASNPSQSRGIGGLMVGFVLLLTARRRHRRSRSVRSGRALKSLGPVALQQSQGPAQGPNLLEATGRAQAARLGTITVASTGARP